VALVVGPQGSGRDPLMEAVDREAAGREWRTTSLFFRRGSEDIDQFTHWLSSFARTFGGMASDEVIEAVQAFRRVERSGSLSVAERLEVLRSTAATLLRERARLDRGTVVLLVRGLQHCGAVGLEAIVGLREEMRRRPAPFLIVGDITENADDPHSMVRKRLPDALRVTVGPMAVREVALLVGALLHRRPPPASVARQIYQASGGLPSYVEEVVKGARRRGHPARQGPRPEPHRVGAARGDHDPGAAGRPGAAARADGVAAVRPAAVPRGARVVRR
jgi:hypothetical protein